MNRSDFGIGDRVQLHPATDAWMRGDRYGRVARVSNTYLTLAMDSRRILKVSFDNIVEIVQAQPRVTF